MADQKISALTAFTPPLSTDIMPIVDLTAGATKKITIANLDAYFSSSIGTLTNKTLTSPKINEDVALTTTATKLNYLTSATGTTGTASQKIVFDTSPTLVTPLLGTPTSGTLTNCSGTAASLTAGNVSTVTATNSKTYTAGGNFGVAWARYNYPTDSGTAGLVTPAANTTIPANSIIVAGMINVTTGVTSGGLATVSAGCSNTGGSATCFMGATAKATLVAGYKVASLVTDASPIKVTNSGSLTFTIGTANLTAGVIEVWVQFYTAMA